MITQARLKEIIFYDPETGYMGWMYKNSYRSRPVGKGWITIRGKKYTKNKLVWLYITGLYPKAKIVHIDQDPLNFILSNLKLDTGDKSENTKHFNCGFIVTDESYSTFVIKDGVTTDLGMYNDLDTMLQVAKTCLESMNK